MALTPRNLVEMAKYENISKSTAYQRATNHKYLELHFDDYLARRTKKGYSVKYLTFEEVEKEIQEARKKMRNEGKREARSFKKEE